MDVGTRPQSTHVSRPIQAIEWQDPRSSIIFLSCLRRLLWQSMRMDLNQAFPKRCCPKLNCFRRRTRRHRKRRRVSLSEYESNETSPSYQGRSRHRDWPNLSAWVWAHPFLSWEVARSCLPISVPLVIATAETLCEIIRDKRAFIWAKHASTHLAINSPSSTQKCVLNKMAL